MEYSWPKKIFIYTLSISQWSVGLAPSACPFGLIRWILFLLFAQNLFICRLKALDVVTMRPRASPSGVNVIPVIAKSDTTLQGWAAAFQGQNPQRAEQSEYPYLPVSDWRRDRERHQHWIECEDKNFFLWLIPPPWFSAWYRTRSWGSVDFVKRPDGKEVRARRYPWGMVEGWILNFWFFDNFFFFFDEFFLFGFSKLFGFLLVFLDEFLLLVFR